MSMPTAAAVLLIWKPPGPEPGSGPPWGARTAVSRSGPSKLCPAVVADDAECAAPRDGGRGGVRRDQLPFLQGVFVPEVAQIADRRRYPQHGVRHERGEEHPGPVEVQRIEGAGEEVVELDVQHTCRELEQGAPDQQKQ
jgi:hypothetical protein